MKSTFKLFQEMRALEPWSEPNNIQLAGASTNAALTVSLLIPAKNPSKLLETTTERAYAFLKERFGNVSGSGFEILLIPSPPLELANKLAERYPEVRVITRDRALGKGAALRAGLKEARGKWILFTDSDLPYGLDFFDHAFKYLQEGYNFVTGNRRLPSSVFYVPVTLLPLAYGRHRMGLAFNRVARILLPQIHTTDTQSGIKAMTRTMAFQAFSLPLCPGFFFDLELFLTAHYRGHKHIDLPVTLYLNSEKSTIGLLRQSILAAFWLFRIAIRNMLGLYKRGH